MSLSVTIWAVIFIAFLILTRRGQCQQDAVFRKKVGKYLANYVIRSKVTAGELECMMYCSNEGMCASVNYKPSGTDEGLCEINSKSLGERAADKNTPLLESADFNHLHIIKRVRKFEHIMLHFLVSFAGKYFFKD